MRILTIIVDVSTLTDEEIMNLENVMVGPTEEFGTPILQSDVKDIDESQEFVDESNPERDLESDPTLH